MLAIAIASGEMAPALEGHLEKYRKLVPALALRELQDGFTAREVHQHDWSGLTDREQVQAGLDLLVDLNFLAASRAATSERGGRPTTTYAANPRSVTPATGESFYFAALPGSTIVPVMRGCREQKYS
jgi:hypothetical protein